MANPVGLAKVVHGQVDALGPTGSRALSEGGSIFKGDTITTSKGSASSIQFSDKSVLNIGEGSKVSIDNYVFDGSKGNALIKMAHGTFRTVTGEIVKQNPESFKMQSPLATIGIRGTETAHTISEPGQGSESHLVMVFEGKPVIVQPLGGGAFQVLSQAGVKVEVNQFGAGPVLVMTPQEYKYFEALTAGSLQQQGVPQDVVTPMGNNSGNDSGSPVQSTKAAAEAAQAEAVAKAANEAAAKAAAEAAAKAAEEAAQSGDAEALAAAEAAAKAAAEAAAKAALEAKAAAELAMQANQELFAAMQAQALFDASQQMAQQQTVPDPSTSSNTLAPGSILTLSMFAQGGLLSMEAQAEDAIAKAQAETAAKAAAEAAAQEAADAAAKAAAEAAEKAAADAAAKAAADAAAKAAADAAAKAAADAAAKAAADAAAKAAADAAADAAAKAAAAAAAEAAAKAAAEAAAQAAADAAAKAAAEAAAQTAADAAAKAAAEAAAQAAAGGGGGSGGTSPLTLDLSGYGIYASVDLLNHSLSSGQNNQVLSTSIVNVIGTSYNDFITGDGMANNLSGGAGQDTIVGMSGDDTVIGGAGDDVLQGAEGNDAVYGGDGNDAISGDDGDDIVVGGAGNDTLNGDTGINTASYEHSTASVTVNLTSGTASDGLGGTDSLTGIQNVIGSDYADNITGTTGVNILEGGAGADVLNGVGNNDIYVFREGDLDVQKNMTLAGGDTVRVYGNVNFAGQSTITGAGTLEVAQAGSMVHFTTAQGASFATINFATATSGSTEHVKFHAVAGTPSMDLANVTISGASASDTIYLFGDAQANNFVGSSIADVIYGGDGDDTLLGSDGNDTVNGGAGTDTLDYSRVASDFPLNINIGAGTVTNGLTQSFDGFEHIIGGQGEDTITGSANFATIIEGGTDDDTLTGGGKDTLSYEHDEASVTVNLDQLTANDGSGHVDDISGGGFINLVGSAFNDLLTGDTGDNIIEGGLGNDTLKGGLDTMPGEDGLDTVSYEHAAAGVLVSLVAGTSSDGAGNDSFSGFENILGSRYTDGLSGDEHDNVIEGGAGSDALHGGGGTDTLSFAHASAAVTVTLALGGTGTVSTESTGTDTYDGFANLMGSAHGDVLTGNSENNALQGLAGNDTLIGTEGNDSLYGDGGVNTVDYHNLGTAVSVTLTDNVNDDGYYEGSADHDIYTDQLAGIGNIIGTALADAITGNSDDNVIEGRGANTATDSDHDVLDGGGGSDTLSYATLGAGVTLSMPLGTATYTLGGATHTDQFSGFETIIGTNYNDSLTGGFDNNVLEGMGGDDELYGYEGVDTASYEHATSGVTVSLAISVAQDTHGAGTDTLLQIDNIIGSAFADALTGDTGANELFGNGGADTLTGGNGSDIFWFTSAGSESTITDFSSDDYLCFYKGVGDFSAMASGFCFELGSFSTTDQATLLFDTGDNTLYYDADGAGGGTATAVASFASSPTIAEDNILVNASPPVF